MLTVPLTGFLHFTSPCPILSLIKSNFVLSNIESPSWTLPLELGKGSVIHSNFPTFIFQGLLSFLQIIGYYIELSSSFNANNTHILMHNTRKIQYFLHANFYISRVLKLGPLITLLCLCINFTSL